jgi:hypothetical protein
MMQRARAKARKILAPKITHFIIVLSFCADGPVWTVVAL